MVNRKRWNLRDHLCWTARIAIGWILLYSGLVKLRLPFVFLSSVYSFDLLGDSTGFLVALFLPALEVTLGIFMIAGACLVEAFGAAIILFTLFSVALSTVFYRELDVTCGCFGFSHSPVNRVTIARTMGLAAVSVALLLHETSKNKSEGNAAETG